MPPLQGDQNTGQTNNSSSAYSGGYDSSSGYSGSTGATGSAVGSSQDLAARDKYIADLVEAINNATEHGNDFEREQLKAKYEDAKKGRDNAYKIAKMEDDTRRYGYDQQRQTDIDKLKEDQRQYDSNHALDLKKYGLSVAEAYTKYANTADQHWVGKDFENAMSRVGQGLNVGSSATEPEAHAKTWQDFAALSGYDTGNTTSTGATNTGTTYTASGSGTNGSGTTSGNSYNASSTGGGADSSGGTGDSGGGTQTATDQRQTAINAVTKAIQPSDDSGHDDQDWAALNAIKALYFAGKPGAVNRLGSARTKVARAGLTRLGYDADTVTEDNQRAGIGQQSVRAA